MSSVSDIDDLATISGIMEYLENNPQFAAQRVEKLSGGNGNFVYRIYLRKPFAGHETLVLKYAPPYIASIGRSFPWEQKRQLIEAEALRLATQLSTDATFAFIKVPVVHSFDEERHVLIMDDAGEESRTLKQVLIEEGLSTTLSEKIGTALGEFISSVHGWNQNPDVDLTLFADNLSGKLLSGWAAYGRIESTLTGKNNIASLSDPLLEIPQAKMETISELAEKRRKDMQATSASDPMTHGDLWPGNLMLSLKRDKDGFIEDVEEVYVLDWELSKTGLPGVDLGQFCAELYTLSEFYPTQGEASRTMTESFLGAYRDRRGTGGDNELARMVVSHMGAHLVTWTPRVSSWSGREKTREVVAKGVEMLVQGEEGLKTSIVAPLMMP